MALQFDLEPDEVELFIQEADEHLQALDEDLVRLEQEGDNQELLQEIFRAAHTLKGAAGMINHRRMADLTHIMENVLDGFRKETLTPTPSLIDALLEGLDLLKILKEEVITLEESAIDVEGVVATLEALSTAEVSEAGSSEEEGRREELHGWPLSAEEESRLQARQAEGWSVFLSEVVIASDSIAPAARAMLVTMDLNRIGEVISSRPTLQEIEAGQVAGRLDVILATPEEQVTILCLIDEIMEIQQARVKPYGMATEEVQLPDGKHPVIPDFPATPVAPQPIQPSPSPSPSVRSPEVVTETISPDRDQRDVNLGPLAAGKERDRRIIDLGPEARGKSKEELLHVAAQKSSIHVSKTIRTSVERLDNLMNLVGELVTDRTRLFQIRADLEAAYGDDGSVARLSEAVTHVARITDELQEEVMRVRMVPIENVFNKFPRVVRDLSRKAGKKIDLHIYGKETELDRSVTEEIGDPLMHLIRNSVDHGIESPEARVAAGKPETGTVTLSARHEENQIVITVEDDGGGIDAERVKASAVQKGMISAEAAAKMSEREAVDLIFGAGVSTAERITDISGRGVGMDVVRTNIERLNGSVSVRTELGKGSRFDVRMPLTLAIVPSLLVSLAEKTYAVPLSSVTETLRIRKEEIKTIRGRENIQLRGHVLPLLRLGDFFGFARNGHGRDKLFVVAVRWGEMEVGFVVDSLVGQQEMVIKSLGDLMGDIRGLSGGGILGDGSIALIVDVPSIVKTAIQENNVGRL
ncbi:MAG: chemotaxis protein CheA [Chloroflexi bacterium]|nr:chemotaxis protein CheA [Chloroflexota bacterium]